MSKLRPRMTMKNGGRNNGSGGVTAGPMSGLADKLARLGMPSDEALVYVRLMNAGPSTPATVAPMVGFTRQKVYRTFEAMAAHGFATASVTRPRRFSPVRPATVIQLLHGRLEALESEFDDALSQTVPSLEALRGLHVEQPEQVHFTLVRGADAVAEQTRLMSAEARIRIEGMIAHPNDKPLAVSLAAAEVAPEVAARLLVVRRAAALVPLVARKADVRLVDEEPLVSALLADGRECLVVVSPQDGKASAEPSLAYRSNAPGLVAMHRVAFEGLWKTARPGPAR